MAKTVGFEHPQVVMLLNILVAAVGVPLMRILCLMFYFVSMCCAISIAFAEQTAGQPDHAAGLSAVPA
ncbi:hypothetical protein HPB52_000827 [Rhipicephalus sanguineus]|uniref:Uncharacterized protein n=1 Tax=Rhipicephalus sanguineus TaxID=34632 RepID=A0A9D4PT76_RHISA|nr:hypothetical protein HPB52_000827 [Rhipicephalus sanguineus]